MPKTKQRIYPTCLTTGLTLLACGHIVSAKAQQLPPANEERPNFLIIVSDDQRYDTMQYMPQTTSRVFEEGVTFERAYVTTAQCGPSRASILTGMYAHNHGMLSNEDPLEETTLVEHLHNNGYHTGIVGKYLNSYPTSENDPPLPEFDQWVNMISGLDSALYYNPRLGVNGQWDEFEGYQTYVLQDFALEFLARAINRGQPFFLMFTPYAPHRPADPASGDEFLYPDLPKHNPPNFNEPNLTDKPVWMQENLPRLTTEQIRNGDGFRRKGIQSLNALDQSIASLIEYLDEQGELDNTVIFYLSDNGVSWGEHRLDLAKVFVYEEATHVPFAMRYPPLVAEPYIEDRLVSNIDIAPTIYDLAGLPIPDNVDGMSLRNLVSGGSWREHLFLEAWPRGASGAGLQTDYPPFVAVHTGEYVYVETKDDLSEFYDLSKDPYQLTNAIGNPAYDDEIGTMQQILAEEDLGYPQPEEKPKASIQARISLFRMWLQAEFNEYSHYRRYQALAGGMILALLGVAFHKKIFRIIRKLFGIG
jgi:N-acetylglucosamine-6-sulfatase